MKIEHTWDIRSAAAEKPIEAKAVKDEIIDMYPVYPLVVN
jgi:hypothetical protein